MTPRSFLLTPELAEYVRASSEGLDEVARDLIDAADARWETVLLPLADGLTMLRKR